MISGYIEVKESQDLKTFFKDKIGMPEELLTPELLERNKELNPEVEDFNSLKPETFLFVEIPADMEKDIKVKLQAPPQVETIGPEVEERVERASNSLSAFYTASLGTFREEISGVKITSHQDSPITLGLSGIKNIDRTRFFAGSTYVSYLDPSRSNDDVVNSIPPEYGFTAHLNWDKDNWPVVYYAGLEFERFSTYNIEEVANSEDIAVLNHHILYAALGISNDFVFMDRKFLFKGSLGKSLVSNSGAGGDPFEGFKYILFLATHLEGKWGLHSFFKQHILSGTSDLNVTRIGLGVSYSIF